MGTNKYGSTKAYNEKPDEAAKFRDFNQPEVKPVVVDK